MKNSSIKIREASPGQASILSHLIRQSFRDVAQKFNLTPENCPRHPSNCQEAWVLKDIERGVVFYLLEENGIPIGCAAMEKANPELFYLERLSVLPQFRRNGYGRLLVDHIFHRAKNLGARGIGIGIISKQTELKRWYQNIGFIEKEEKAFPHLPFIVSFMEYEF